LRLALSDLPQSRSFGGFEFKPHAQPLASEPMHTERGIIAAQRKLQPEVRRLVNN
jgi:hypothetical protein